MGMKIFAIWDTIVWHQPRASLTTPAISSARLTAVLPTERFFAQEVSIHTAARCKVLANRVIAKHESFDNMIRANNLITASNQTYPYFTCPSDFLLCSLEMLYARKIM